MKFICITGYSGGGKTTMSRIMEKHLPNNHTIRVEEEMLKIYDTDDMENKYGLPVGNDNILVYLYKVANLDVLNGERKFFDLSRPYIEAMIEKKICSISHDNKSDYIIIEWVALPLFKVWNQAYSRIVIEPVDFEELIQRIIVRPDNSVQVTREVAEKRIAAVRDVLSGVNNTTFHVINNYNEEYEVRIKDICSKIIYGELYE